MALVDKNPLNVEHANVPSSHSHFPLNAILAGTNRFGEVSPHFVARVVAGDKNVKFMSGTETRSLNLVSPVMQEIKQEKTYFQVPMPAILPLNWDKLYVQPSVGDDVVAENVGTCVEDSWLNKVSVYGKLWFNSIIANAYDSDNDDYKFDGKHLANLLKCLNWFGTIFSAGSLSAQLGNNFWPLFIATDFDGNESNFDAFFDSVISKFLYFINDVNSYKIFATFDNHSTYYLVSPDLNYVGSEVYDYNGDAYQIISFRRFLELIHDDPHFDLSFGYDEPSENLTVPILNIGGVGNLSIAIGNRLSSTPEIPLNLDVYAAYQLSIAEYMSNDKVDYVYSSELYRQVMRSAWKQYASVTASQGIDPFVTFSWNGNNYLYDEFSAYFFMMLINALGDDVVVNYTNIDSVLPAFLDCWNLIFNIRNSLRFGDYFAGGKPSPLAPIDVTVPVTSNKVSMVDVARQKGYLRLAFASSRIGRKLSKYSEEIMHTVPPVDFHHPWYLARTSDVLGSHDTENTNIDPSASGQPAQSTISNIYSQSNNFAFETDIDINSVIIGVTTYDITRLYDKGISRFNWHFDRYDMFNPLLQFSGDQDVKVAELDVTLSGNEVCYQDKYSEYKQVINRCFGGLCLDSVLPGWVMRVTDRYNTVGVAGLSPSFIRSYPFELDRFYLSLTGMSPATYFHFIVKHTNFFDLDRPMVAKPKIM